MNHMLVNLVALACVGVAGYLAAHERAGWGWFLFVALICCVRATFAASGRKP